MLLYSKENSTMRLLERCYGAELRYNRQVFFANNDLTKIIKFVIKTSGCDYPPSYSSQSWVDEKTVRDTLHKLSDAGIPLSFWGEFWSNTEVLSANHSLKIDL
ncbi:hypothetical protein [Fastidiosibacter lacustris]|uniref:hypothetical protein n=1 Tax=Fastidiosibacter lacustris TaxID=2056695 RepID=UPI000E340E31|nr:hypothetical protein [Fastidiosibacter lacustris]